MTEAVKQANQDLPIAGFQISGFRTLHKVRVQARGPVTVICGPNNVGKSSLLASLRFYPMLLSTLQGRPTHPPSNRLKGNIKVEVAVNLRSKTVQDQIKRGVTQGVADILWKRLGAEIPDILWLPFAWSDKAWKLNAKAACSPFENAIRHVARQEQQHVVQALTKPFGFSALNQEWPSAVAKRCLPQTSVTFIPDIRRSAEKPLSDEDVAELARANARHTGSSNRIAQWADMLERVLRDVFGDDVRYEVWPTDNAGDFRLRIDGEEDRELGQVGAGVREVVAIAHAALKNNGASVLAIEEPENCLHPIAVKRLIQSLSKRAGVQLFVSTHSSAVINANPDTIIHLSRDGTQTTSREVMAAADRYDAVRSLGYSPADLVLTPCAVWVEGPSDRLYLTAWLREHGLIEGIDYQVMFFGGALAAHVTVTADTLPQPALAAIRNLSRYCAVVVDSDRNKPHTKAKRHVQRFRKELARDEHAHLLVTHGREIENYLPHDLVNRLRRKYGKRAIGPSQFRYERVVDPALNRKISKVRFAKEALVALDGEVPTGARADINKLAEFIRAATIS